MRNIALKLMYNGTAYHGWQVQKNAVTVCGTLEKAIADICGGPVHLTGCGRTDAGVHAEHYIANFRTDSRIPVDRIPFAINTHTPEDIAVKEAFEVAEDFNAIGSCIKKEYTYRIYNSRFKNPFYVNRAYFYPKHLDEEFLNRAAGMFVGTHDFAAVRSFLWAVWNSRERCFPQRWECSLPSFSFLPWVCCLPAFSNLIRPRYAPVRFSYWPPMCWPLLPSTQGIVSWII